MRIGFYDKDFLLPIRKIGKTIDILFVLYVEPILLKRYVIKTLLLNLLSLRKECENYCFNLDDSNCNPKDVTHILIQYKNDKLQIWEMFFDSLFARRNRCENIIRKCDAIFQIVLDRTWWQKISSTIYRYFSKHSWKISFKTVGSNF